MWKGGGLQMQKVNLVGEIGMGWRAHSHNGDITWTIGQNRTFRKIKTSRNPFDFLKCSMGAWWWVILVYEDIHAFGRYIKASEAYGCMGVWGWVHHVYWFICTGATRQHESKVVHYIINSLIIEVSQLNFKHSACNHILQLKKWEVAYSHLLFITWKSSHRFLMTSTLWFHFSMEMHPPFVKNKR